MYNTDWDILIYFHLSSALESIKQGQLFLLWVQATNKSGKLKVLWNQNTVLTKRQHTGTMKPNQFQMHNTVIVIYQMTYKSIKKFKSDLAKKSSWRETT